MTAIEVAPEDAQRAFRNCLYFYTDPGGIYLVNGKLAVGNLCTDFFRFHEITQGNRLHALFMETLMQCASRGLYSVMSGTSIFVSKMCIADYDVINRLTQKDHIANQLNTWNRNVDSDSPSKLPWVFSIIPEGFHPLCEAQTFSEKTPASFKEFAQQHRRPPSSIISPCGSQVPLHGMMEMLAVGRALADLQTIGKNCNSAGFVWEKDDHGNIIAARCVKICFDKILMVDPKNYGMNLDYRTSKQTGAPPRWLKDLKNIQAGHADQDMVFEWDKLSDSQRVVFLETLSCITGPDRRALGKFHLETDLLNRREFPDIYKGFPADAIDGVVEDWFSWMDLQREIYEIDPKPSE